jgi:hypothetical protein
MNDPTRRECLALLAAAPLAAATPAAAQEKPASVADALFAVARAKYGGHLNAEQLDEVRRAIQRDQFSAEQLRKVPLRNGDEPAFVFRAD